MRLGRPKIAAGERKTKITGVRLDKTERKLLEKAARLKRSSLSIWMRDVLLSSAKKELVRLTTPRNINAS
jgi:uncharacterized protein (DUF1778 family)